MARRSTNSSHAQFRMSFRLRWCRFWLSIRLLSTVSGLEVPMKDSEVGFPGNFRKSGYSHPVQYVCPGDPLLHSGLQTREKREISKVILEYLQSCNSTTLCTCLSCGVCYYDVSIYKVFYIKKIYRPPQGATILNTLRTVRRDQRMDRRRSCFQSTTRALRQLTYHADQDCLSGC